MSSIIKAVGSLIGIGSSPSVDTKPATDETGAAQDQASLARASLFETAGGASGSQLQPGQVGSSRATLFGN